jgi:DNA-binding response OmpR family regulator
MNMDEKRKILIVDDDPFMQSLYSKTLEREGFIIQSACDGLAAIEMVPHLSADLVVLDMMLPKIHGLKVLEAIRADSLHKSLPVLILSNSYLPDIAKEAMEVETTMGLLKSECSPKRLVKIIRDILKISTSEDCTPLASRDALISSLSEGKAEIAHQRGGLANPTETAVLAELQNELLRSWPTDISMIREQCLKYVKTVGSQESEEHLKNIYRSLRLLSARATMSGYNKVSQLSTALEAMLFEYGFNRKDHMSPSVVQTMVQAVDCFEHLFKSGNFESILCTRKTRILLVDDDAVCNKANDIALKRANFDTACVSDGIAALELIENIAFDLILLDINMPVLTGFEVCAKIREIPQCKDTPVIFVTIHSDFQSRAQSVLSGSNGFIAKPISPLELIVKALVFLLRQKEVSMVQPSAPKPASLPLLAASATQATQLATPREKLNPQTEQAELEGRGKELKATQAAVDDKVEILTQALEAETKRRENAEREAAESARRRSKLEANQVENEKALESFERLLEESQKQIQNVEAGQVSKVIGRKRALESVRSFVEDKITTLTKALVVEKKRGEFTKQQVTEYAKRRSELEAALAATKQAKENLLRDIHAAGNGKLRGTLEAALAENHKTQISLMQKMEETRQEFQTQQKGLAAELPRVEVRTKELEASQAALVDLKSQHAGVTQQVQALSESLAAESGRREAAEKQAAELLARRAELEQELAQHTQAQSKLRAELAEQQQRLDTQVQAHNVELGDSTARTKELEASEAALMELKSQHAGETQQVQALSESLAAESGRREAAEKQAAELMAMRTELEQDLAERTLMQNKLLAELVEHQQRLDSQVQTSNAELGNSTARIKELEASQAALVDLKSQHAGVTQQVRALSESLAAESGRREAAEKQAAELVGRRTELEQELAQHTQAQSKLRAELAEQQQRLDTQVQAHHVELENLSTRTKELEASQAALVDLKSQHAGVTQQVRALSESLAAESGRREAAEKQAAELVGRRTELEQELAQHTQAQSKLRAELAEQQQRLDTQVQAHHVELENLSTRTKELEASQAALVDLKSQHAGVTQQVRALSESLAAESGRREAAEKQAAELVGRRTELEQELAQHTQAQSKLRAELAEQQQRLDTQVQAHHVELENLSTRTKELEASQAALVDLKSQHAGVTQQVRALSESLAAESGRREAAEKQAAELVGRRTELEQELAQHTQAQSKLRAELAEQQQRLDTQVQAHHVELENLSTRTKELEASQAALVDLKSQHAGVTQQVRALSESLAAESGRREAAEKQAAELVGRRTELEQELAQHTQAQSKLRAELAEQQQRLDTQVQAHHVELENLSTRTKELEASQAALVDLKSQHAGVTQQVRALSESLAAESGRREAAEKQAAELVGRRTELEQELAQHTQAQSKLRAELAEQQQRITAVSAEMDSVRSQAIVEALRQKEMAGHIAESEQARAELGKKLNAARELSSTQEADIRALEIELQQRRGEHERLDALYQVELAQRRRLETQIESIQSKLDEASSLLAQKCAAEQTWLVRESELQSSLRNQQDEIAKSSATLAIQEAEIKKSREQIEEMQVLQSALCAKVQDLTQQVQTSNESLANESGRRATAEQQAAELLACRAELERELAQRTQAQEQLRAELAELQKRLDAQVQAHNVELDNLSTRTKELEAAHVALAELKTQHAGVTEQVRLLTESLNVETSRRAAGEEQVAQLVARRIELEQAIDQHTQVQEQLRRELAAQVQAHHVELENLSARTMELEAAQAALAELKTHHAGVIEQVRSLTELLATETGRRATAEQAWLARESELQNRIGNQQDEIAKSGATLAGKVLEIKNAREKIEELQVFQSALCSQVQDLNERAESAAKIIQELKAKAARSENAVENALQKLAGLRYVILDASRMSARLHRERSQKERQNLEAIRQLLSCLSQTPLSLAQRGMLAELQNSVDSLKNGRPGTTKIAAYPAELPGLRGSEFSFEEVTGSAFGAVRAAAGAAGVAVQVSTSGTTTGKLIGCAEHIHQLITLLAVSPLTIMTGINALDLRVAIKVKDNRFAEMNMRVALSSDNNAQDLLARLTAVIRAAFTLQTGSFNESELGLAAGWQLAQAMGAEATVEIDGNQEACLVLSLPIETRTRVSLADGETVLHVPSNNGNGNYNGSRLNKSRAALSDNNSTHNQPKPYIR